MIKLNLQFFGGRGGAGGKRTGSSTAAESTGTGSVVTSKKVTASTKSTTSKALTAADVISNQKAEKSVANKVMWNALRDAQNETKASEAGVARTLKAAATKEGVFRSDFNDTKTRAFLSRKLGDSYEFREVDTGKKMFMTKTPIKEWRLFKKK